MAYVVNGKLTLSPEDIDSTGLIVMEAYDETGKKIGSAEVTVTNVDDVTPYIGENATKKEFTLGSDKDTIVGEGGVQTGKRIGGLTSPKQYAYYQGDGIRTKGAFEGEYHEAILFGENGSVEIPNLKMEKTPWKMLLDHAGTSELVDEIYNVNRYSEFLIECRYIEDRNRVLASTVIDAESFLVIGHEVDGYHQCKYSDSVRVGCSVISVSENGAASVSKYASPEAYLRIYGR